MDRDVWIVLGCVGVAIWLAYVIWQYVGVMSSKSAVEQDRILFGAPQSPWSRSILIRLAPRLPSSRAFLLAIGAVTLIGIGSRMQVWLQTEIDIALSNQSGQALVAVEILARHGGTTTRIRLPGMEPGATVKHRMVISGDAGVDVKVRLQDGRDWCSNNHYVQPGHTVVVIVKVDAGSCGTQKLILSR